VTRVEAYRTVSYPAAPDRRLLPPQPGAEAVVTTQGLAGAVVVLTSPSAARELGRQVPGAGRTRPGGTRFVAIGEPTRRAAQSAGIDLIGTAASPDAPGLLAVLDGSPGPSPH
jgi:uroporphyrinogen-III synthase